MIFGYIYIYFLKLISIMIFHESDTESEYLSESSECLHTGNGFAGELVSERPKGLFEM